MISLQRRSILVVALSALAVFFSGCAANVGSTIEAPEIPAIASRPDARARLQTTIAIQDVQDTRPAPLENEDGGFTAPYGGVNGIVQTGIKNAFRDAGISVIDSAPLAIRAEVKKWQAQVNAKGTSTITSEATLFVELIDPSGKKVFSGSYNGTRSSQFPVVTRIDIKDSLGLAMANAISQIVSDPKLNELIGSY